MLPDGRVLDVVRLPDGGYSIRSLDGTVSRIDVVRTQQTVDVTTGGRTFVVEVQHERDALLSSSAKKVNHGGKLTVSMPGKVVKVLVSAGDIVIAGQPILIIEAMKMENEVRSPGAGRVTLLHVKEGDNVEAGTVLAEIGVAEDS
ncbi:MAG: biotin/lipoyl-binding protein [Myxococcales bacterium]|nr:biotin/lipoyl-binding protein [Myxococcales bacterium]